MGDYGRLNNFFDPIASPLLPYAKTLESLTITTKELGGKETYCNNLGFLLMSCRCNWQGGWFLAFLKNLVALCIPFWSFAKARIISYPPLLRDLILVGYLRDRYFEPEMDVKRGEIGISDIFRFMVVRTGLQSLKRMRVLVNDNTNSRAKEYVLPELAKALGVDLQRGAGKPYGLGAS